MTLVLKLVGRHVGLARVRGDEVTVRYFIELEENRTTTKIKMHLTHSRYSRCRTAHV